MHYDLTIGWLYPELMSTYGDRGNILILQKRCTWRGIGCIVMPIDFKTVEKDMDTVDLLFGGGAQDRQQGILIDDLRVKKGPVLKRRIDMGIPGLFVCGSPQLLGHSYMTGDGTTLQGLGIFDMESRHFGKDKPRCIGNMVYEIPDSFRVPGLAFRPTVVGFENHGGRTYLGTNVQPFGHILVGNGNNGEDKTEGAIYRKCIATYSHGPLLSKNPHIADWLIYESLKKKYRTSIKMKKLPDIQEWQAHAVMLTRLGL